MWAILPPVAYVCHFGACHACVACVRVRVYVCVKGHCHHVVKGQRRQFSLCRARHSLQRFTCITGGISEAKGRLFWVGEGLYEQVLVGSRAGQASSTD